MTALLEARNLRKVFSSGTFVKQQTVAVDGISLTVEESPPSITAIAGESGSGKTTLARMLVGLLDATEGEIIYKGQATHNMTRAERRQFRREVQTIFQDPFEVYNPFYKVDHVLTTPLSEYGLAKSKREARQLIGESLEEVGLRPDEILGRYPHQLSGGQRQRIMVARTLLLRPRIIVADEPVSMVDASLRATILEELRDLNQNHGISILYITHDLTTAYQIADNIIVMYQGRVAEAGDVELVINDPQHPYTRLLVESIPQPDPALQWGQTDTVGMGQPETSEAVVGCNFFDRCPVRMDMCSATPPPMYRTDEHRLVRCFVYRQSEEYGEADLSGAMVPRREVAPAADH